MQTFHKVGQYLKAKSRWLYAPAVITSSGEMLITSKGKQYSKEEFDACCPKPHYEPPSGDSLHGNKNGLLYGVKCKKK